MNARSSLVESLLRCKSSPNKIANHNVFAALDFLRVYKGVVAQSHQKASFLNTVNGRWLKRAVAKILIVRRVFQRIKSAADLD